MREALERERRTQADDNQVRADRERAANEEKARQLQLESEHVEALKTQIANLEQQAKDAKAAADAEVQKAEDAKKKPRPRPPRPLRHHPPADRPTEPPRLVSPIEAELHRIGCYDSGEKGWDAPEVRLGLAEYARYAKLSATPSVADSALLDSLRSRRDRLCPLECGAGEVPLNGRCVAAGPMATPRLTAAREAERPAATHSTVQREATGAGSPAQAEASISRGRADPRSAGVQRPLLQLQRRAILRVMCVSGRPTVWLAIVFGLPSLALPSRVPAGQYTCQVPASVLCPGCSTDVAIAIQSGRRLPGQLQHRPALGDRSSFGNGYPADRDAGRAGASARYRSAKSYRGGATRAQGGLLRVQRPTLLRVIKFACVGNRPKHRSLGYQRSARPVEMLPVRAVAPALRPALRSRLCLSRAGSSHSVSPLTAAARSLAKKIAEKPIL